MAIVLTDSKHYSGIAEAIREKTGSDTTYRPEDMPSGIADVYDAGHEFGWAAGSDHGRIDGQMLEYESFWNAFQKNGERTNYWYGFAGFGWTKNNLRPYHKIIFAENNNRNQFASGLFYRCGGNDYDGTPQSCINFDDIKEEFDFRGLKSARQIFNSCYMVNIYADFSDCEVCQLTFAMSWGGYMDNITIKVSEKLTDCSDMFAYNVTLKNLAFTDDSVIACNGLDVSACTGLTHDSLMSILNALQNKTDGTWAVTLGTTNLGKLSDSEKAIATEKGWTLV